MLVLGYSKDQVHRCHSPPKLCVVFVCSSIVPAVCKTGSVCQYVIKMCPFMFNLVFSFLFSACSHIATPLVSLLFATLLICVIGAAAGVQESPRYAGRSNELKQFCLLCSWNSRR